MLPRPLRIQAWSKRLHRYSLGEAERHVCHRKVHGGVYLDQCQGTSRRAVKSVQTYAELVKFPNRSTVSRGVPQSTLGFPLYVNILRRDTIMVWEVVQRGLDWLAILELHLQR